MTYAPGHGSESVMADGGPHRDVNHLIAPSRYIESGDKRLIIITSSPTSMVDLHIR